MLNRRVPIFLFFVGACFVGASGYSDPQNQRSQISFGQILECTIEPEERQMFELNLTEDSLVNVRAVQQGADIRLTLYDPDGQKWGEMDAPTGSQGLERFILSNPKPGKWSLEVWAFKNAGGAYQLLVDLEPNSLKGTELGQSFEIMLEGIAAVKAKNENGVALLRNAAKRWRALEEPLLEVRCHVELGKFFKRQNAYAQAAESYMQARSILPEESLCPWFQTIGDNAAKCYDRASQPGKAETAYKKSLQDAASCGSMREEAVILSNYGRFLKHLGQYRKALLAYNQASNQFTDLGEARLIANSKVNISVLYTFLGKISAALHELENAESLLSREKDPGLMGAVYTQIGWCHYLSGDYERAIGVLEDAINLKAQAGRKLEGAGALDRLATVYRASGSYSRAQELYEKALSMYPQTDPLRAEVLSNLGQLQFEMGKDHEARDFLLKAVDLFKSDSPSQMNTWKTLAEIARDAKQYPLALKYVEKALAPLDSARSQSWGRILKRSFSKTRQEYFGLAIDIQMRMHGMEPDSGFDEKAWMTGERNRAHLLLESLVRGQDAHDSELPEQALRQIDELALKRIKPETPDADGPLMSALMAVDLETLDLGQVSIPQPFSLAQVRETLLDDETVILNYQLGEKQSYLFEIRKAGLRVHLLPNRETIESQAVKLFKALENSHRRSYRWKWRVAAAEMSDLILSPVRGTTAKRLIIVPDGRLNYIPFAVLTSSEISLANWQKSYRPLIEDFEIGYLPSLSYGVMLRKNLEGRQPASKTIAMFTDPVTMREDSRLKFEAARQDERIDPNQDSAKEMRLSRLVYSQNVIAAISKMTEPEERFVLEGFNASKQKILAADLTPYAILHFSAHGFTDPSFSELSGLVFSLYNKNGLPQDGFLRTHDLYYTRMPCELAVVNACQVAVNEDLSGEGIWGLTRGLMTAGVGRVVASLWNVEDRAGAILMETFYEQLLERELSPCAALRMAQLSILQKKQYQEPYYWAGFLHQGDWGKVKLKK